jgi:putative transposase
MAKARLLAPWVESERRSAIYHTISRVVHRQMLLGDAEKEQFVKYMRMYEAFCGVRVLSFCVMTNHFHLLVEVPPKMDQELSDEALINRLSLLYSKEYVGQVGGMLRELAESTTPNGRKAHAELREKFTRRMWDLGSFMKTLKQRFTSWYNARHGRCGTLWEARYKSVLVEDGEAARVMAAYIDLNPVRAGMVGACTSSRSSAGDPSRYRWCSYAEAVAGGARGALSRRGLARVLEERENQGDSDSAYDGWEGYSTPEHYAWRAVAQRYRLILFEDGEEIVKFGKVARKGMSNEVVEAAMERDGRLSRAAVLRCKTRYFVDGGVIGGKEFVSGVVKSLMGSYLKEDRKSKGSKMPRHKGSLWSMRRLTSE